MAGNAHTSNVPDTRIRDATGDVAGHFARTEGPTVPQPGVGRPAAYMRGSVDFRDNDGDGGAAGAGPDQQAMRGDAGC